MNNLDVNSIHNSWLKISSENLQEIRVVVKHNVAEDRTRKYLKKIEESQMQALR